MIFEAILNVIFNIATAVLSILPDFTWSVPTSWVGFVYDAMSVAGYLLPLGTIQTIASLILGLLTIRVFIALVKTIWDLLPVL